MATTSYAELPNERIRAENGIEYVYRDAGNGPVPLILLQHFRGNLDSWDPALVDALATSRRVVAFDNVGVGGTSGVTPSTVREMARGVIAFIGAMRFEHVDVLGFSIGSFVAQEIALLRPDLVRRVILASSAPKGAAGMHGWAPEIIGAVGKPETTADDYLRVFFTASETSGRAGVEALHRMNTRQEDRDEATTWETRLNQYDAVCEWGIPNYGLLQRLEALDAPVFVANGDRDPMILTRYSYLLAGFIQKSVIKIYPDSAHGFLFQHHADFARDVSRFLDAPVPGSAGHASANRHDHSVES
jgi:pimeloyl-ACP methyl ester carboxylesterase